MIKKQPVRTLVLWISILAVAGALVQWWRSRPDVVPLSRIVIDSSRGQIESLVVHAGSGRLLATYKGHRDRPGRRLVCYVPPGTDLLATLRAAGLPPRSLPEVTFKPRRFWQAPFFQGLILILLLLAGVLAIFWLRDGRALAFTKVKSDRPAVRFHQVGGLARAKQSLEDVIDFLRRPQVYMKEGCEMPGGILLSGPPGIGKTLLARAVAGEAKVPFYFCSGSEFLEMFVGVGAARIRDLFRQAREAAPCIVFIDEIDAIGSMRTSRGNLGGREEHNQALNQLLSEMDGFDQSRPIVVLAATNRSDMLDPALLRTGRFDRVIEIEPPDDKERRDILAIYLKDSDQLQPPEIENIVRQTERHRSGSDLKTLLNIARIHAVRERNLGALRWDDIVYAFGEISRNHRGFRNFS